MRGILVSHRSRDVPGQAGRLADRLRLSFPGVRVLVEDTKVEPGEDIFKAVESTVSACDVLVVVIGQHWLADRDGQGQLTDSQDQVRLEIAAALRNQLRVIPVLVDGASMPPADILPHEIEDFARHQAAELRDTRWDADVQDLISSLAARTSSPVPSKPATYSWAVRLGIPTAVGVAIIVIGSVISWLSSGPKVTSFNMPPSMTLIVPKLGGDSLGFLSERRLALSSGSALMVLDLGTAEEEQISFKGSSEGWTSPPMLALPEGRFAVGKDCGQIQIWSAETRKIERTLKIRGPWLPFSRQYDCAPGIKSLSLLSNGAIFYLSDDYRIGLWDLKTGPDLIPNPTRYLQDHSKHGVGQFRVMLPDGRVAFSSGETIEVWNAKTHEVESTLRPENEEPITSMALLPDGQIVTGTNDGIVRLWNLEAGTARVLGSEASHSFTQSLVLVLRNGAILVIRKDTIETWGSNREHPDNVSPGFGQGVRGSPMLLADGRVAIPSDDNEIRIWSPKTRQVDAILQRPRDDMRDTRTTLIASSAAGQVAAAIPEYGVIFVWNLNQSPLGQKTLSLSKH